MTLSLRQIRALYLATKVIDNGNPALVKDDKGQERVTNLSFTLPAKVRYALARNNVVFEPLVAAFEKAIAAQVKAANKDETALAKVEDEGQALLDTPEELAKVFTITEADYLALCEQPIPANALGALVPIVQP